MRPALALCAAATAALAACPGPSHPSADAGVDAGPRCHASADCDGGEICIGGADGGAGSCGPCRTNGDCLPDQQCASASLGAAPGCAFLPGWGDQCVLNGDCALGQFCKQGLCAAQANVTLCIRGNCPTGERCNQQNQVCEQDLGCQGDQDCAAGQACNPGTRACQPACSAATAAQVCDPTQKCVGELCVDCTTDADCGPGLTCDIAAGRCGGVNACFSNADCASGQVCDLATQACGSAPPPCASNDDCPAADICDVSTGRCGPAGCQPDVFEPNGTQAQAAPITAGLSYSGLTLCTPSEQDWYSLPLQSGDRIEVTIDTATTGSGYSFDVQLRASDGTILSDGKLALDQTVASSGGYFLRMTDGDADTTYGFSTLVAHGSPCPASPYGSDGSAAQAAALDGGASGPVWLCAGEAQWYVASLPVGSTLTATLSYDPTQGPLTLTVLDGDGTTILGQDQSGRPTETATASQSTNGRIYIEVTGDGRDSNSYTLSLSLGAGG
ncbi:MAG: hypothetical protein ACYCWW_07125 [Deltaproteobacteria bacterium]